MSAVVDLLTGCAQLINTAGLAVWDPDRNWTPADAEWAVVLRSMPEDPSKIVSLSSYTIEDDPKLTDSTLALRIRLRGDENPTSTIAMDESLFDLFHGRHDQVINGVPVVLMWRQSSLPGPQDSNLRWAHSASYYIRTDLPTQFRED